MWTLRGTIGSQLGDVQTPIVVEGQTMTVAEYIGGTYGFEYDSLWYCIVVLIGFCVLFWLVIASACRPSSRPSPYLCYSMQRHLAIWCVACNDTGWWTAWLMRSICACTGCLKFLNFQKR